MSESGSPAPAPRRWPYALATTLASAVVVVLALLGAAQVMALSDNLILLTLGLPAGVAGAGLILALGASPVRRSVGVGLIVGAALGFLVVAGLVVWDLNACCGDNGSGV